MTSRTVSIGTEPSPVSGLKEIDPTAGAARLAEWFRGRAAAYPWRRGIREPYEILVCEFMAQQTQASRVAAAFDAWLARFPDVEALAAASRADVVRAWQGLGYNRRAIALHETARSIVALHGGVVPGDVGALLALPGVGPYTAAAIASIAFGVPVVALDTNIRRVAARVLFGLEPDEIAPARLRDAAQAWLDTADPGTWNQAVMDVGATLCRPRSPRCDRCPLSEACRFRGSGREGRSSSKRQPAFEGSFRQVRGAIVRELIRSGALTSQELGMTMDADHARVNAAIEAMANEGMVERSADGRIRLKE